jgi:hypothetical protein
MTSMNSKLVLILGVAIALAAALAKAKLATLGFSDGW